jgi:hypothetical protein
MINASMISYFPSWCRRRESFRPERNRGKRATGLLAIAGAAAMDSFLGQIWLGDSGETVSLEPLAHDSVPNEPEDDPSAMTARNHPLAH